MPILLHDGQRQWRLYRCSHSLQRPRVGADRYDPFHALFPCRRAPAHHGGQRESRYAPCFCLTAFDAADRSSPGVQRGRDGLFVHAGDVQHIWCGRGARRARGEVRGGEGGANAKTFVLFLGSRHSFFFLYLPFNLPFLLPAQRQTNRLSAVMQLGLAHIAVAIIKMIGAICLLTVWNPMNCTYSHTEMWTSPT